MFTIDGETLCLTDWATRLGVHYKMLWSRINAYGWTLEEAIADIREKKVAV
jgi:hypothetical protein